MVLGIWLPLVIIISFVSNSVGDGFRTEMELPNSDARDAQEMISKVSPSDGGESSQIVIKTTSSIDDETTKTALNAALAEVAKIPRIRVLSPYDVPTQVNPARTIAFAQVTTPEDMSMEEMTVVAEEIKDITASLRTTSGVTIEYGGQLFRVFAMPESEALGLLAAIIILVLAFGSVIAMGLPIGIALLGLAAASGIVVIVSNLMSMPSEATSMVAMIGLGVGIDYALFIVTRYREALHDGMSVEDSIVESIDTSGRAVLFAGITVVVALLGLLSIGLAFVSGFSVAMAIGVAVMMIASVTLLPALLAMVGTRIDNTSRAAVISLTIAVVAAMIAIFIHSVELAVAGVIAAILVQILRIFVAPLRASLPHLSLIHI